MPQFLYLHLTAISNKVRLCLQKFQKTYCLNHVDIADIVDNVDIVHFVDNIDIVDIVDIVDVVNIAPTKY